MAHQARGEPSHCANSLFAAACGRMEKEHGGACADLVDRATACYPAAGEVFVVSGTHRPLFFNFRGTTGACSVGRCLRTRLGASLCPRHHAACLRGAVLGTLSRHAGNCIRHFVIRRAPRARSPQGRDFGGGFFGTRWRYSAAWPNDSSSTPMASL